jgi:hypothetical protein
MPSQRVHSLSSVYICVGAGRLLLPGQLLPQPAHPASGTRARAHTHTHTHTRTHERTRARARTHTHTHTQPLACFCRVSWRSRPTRVRSNPLAMCGPFTCSPTPPPHPTPPHPDPARPARVNGPARLLRRPAPYGLPSPHGPRPHLGSPSQASRSALLSLSLRGPESVPDRQINRSAMSRLHLLATPAMS